MTLRGLVQLYKVQFLMSYEQLAQMATDGSLLESRDSSFACVNFANMNHSDVTRPGSLGVRGAA